MYNLYKYFKYFAILIPIIFVNLWILPKFGINPKLVSGKPNIDFSVHILISQHKESSKPNPNEKPSIMDITGIGSDSNFFRTLFPFMNNSWACCLKIFFISEILKSGLKNFSSELISLFFVLI